MLRGAGTYGVRGRAAKRPDEQVDARSVVFGVPFRRALAQERFALAKAKTRGDGTMSSGQTKRETTFSRERQTVSKRPAGSPSLPPTSTADGLPREEALLT